MYVSPAVYPSLLHFIKTKKSNHTLAWGALSQAHYTASLSLIESLHQGGAIWPGPSNIRLREINNHNWKRSEVEEKDIDDRMR
jgi:hypothetical protein